MFSIGTGTVSEVFCFYHNSTVPHHATFLSSLSFQSNANVLQPSTQQWRLRLVLRVGFLLTDVKPPAGRQATAPLMDRGMEECWWSLAYFGLEFGPISHRHTKAHTPTSLEAARLHRESWRGEHCGTHRNLINQPCFPSLSVFTLMSCLLWTEVCVCVCVLIVCVCVCEWVWECARLTQGNNPIWPTDRRVRLHLRSPSLCTANRTPVLTAPSLLFLKVLIILFASNH